MSVLNYFLGLSRWKKRVVSIAVDILFIIFSFYSAYWVRIGEIQFIDSSAIPYVLLITIVTTIYTFVNFGLYRAILRYLTFHALAVISIGTLVSTIAIALSAFYLDAPIPRSLPIIYGMIFCLLCGGSRMIARVIVYETLFRGRKHVIIYGAGSAGRQLALALKSSDTHKVIAFVDDDLTLKNTVLMGLTVFSSSDFKLLTSKHRIDQVLLAVPSASRSRRREILDSLVNFSFEVLTIPDVKDIVDGKAKIDELKDVAIEDLLGRDPVAPQQSLMEANIKGKVVMVTGAGGSIGSELCRQIVKYSPKALVLFEVSEFALYQIDRELNRITDTVGDSIEVIPLLGTVQKIERLSIVMKSFSVQTVYHAAAYKHVPLVEYNVVEGIKNNIFGTYRTACAAIEAKVESFVLISTDKAVRPTNVMGTTKRMAELGLQALAEKENEKARGTRFCMVRFGNVLGSSGSVVPLFKKQILQGGPVTVTHPEIIRYFMTIPEAAQLVIQAGSMGKGGDVFVLDMGKPVKIADLAKNLIKLSGLDLKDDNNPNGDIEILYTGLRPGEKLYEELLIDDNVSDTAHPRIMTAQERMLPLDKYIIVLDALENACLNYNYEKIISLLIDAPTDFNPSDGISDLVWLHSNCLTEDKA